MYAKIVTIIFQRVSYIIYTAKNFLPRIVEGKKRKKTSLTELKTFSVRY